MPILNLQRQMRELGRIRTGTSVDAGAGRRRAHRLETFRLTSSSRSLIEHAAEAYGGTVAAWGEDQWEVVTTTDRLDIVVPPGIPITSWYELWTEAGLQRRCDGATMTTGGDCLCPSDVGERLALAKRGQACKATTRLSVILPALPDLGLWRWEGHGYYAAVELAGAVDVLASAAAQGRLVPAWLRLEQRTKKVPGQPVSRYSVPVIELAETRLAELVDIGVGVPSLAPGGRRLPELPSTTLPETSDLRGPAVELSVVDLRAALSEIGYPLDAARAVALELFGERELSGEDRAALLAELRERITRDRIARGPFPS